MSSETALTGRLGVFEWEGARIARCTRWSVNPNLAQKSEWGDSDSEGFTNIAAGRKQCAFSVEGKFDTGDAQYNVFSEGDVATAILWMNTTLYWYFTRALCFDFKLDVNIDTEEVVGWSSDFGADGRYYKPGGSSAPSATYPT